MCKLIGFHTNMSCLGSVGYLMSGSGLEDLFRLIYGPESVNNFLVESGLMINPLTAVLATLENEVDVTVVLRVKSSVYVRESSLMAFVSLMIVVSCQTQRCSRFTVHYKVNRQPV